MTFSLILLVVISGFIGKFSISVAKFKKVPDVIIAGLLLGFIGSLGEISLAVSASIVHYEELMLGVVIGGVIAMILFVGGISAIVNKGIPSTSFNHTNILFVLNLSVIVFIYFVSGLSLSLGEGLVLILLFVLFLWQVLKNHGTLSIKSFKPLSSKKEYILAVMTILFLVANLFLTAGFTVENAYYYVNLSGVGQFVTGLVLIAPLCAVPELMFEIEISKKGTSKTALSDLMVSAIINLTLIAGGLAIVHPFTITNTALVTFNLFMLAFVTLIFDIYFFTKHRLERKEGIIMVIAFVAYIVINYFLIV